jgi:hypothetical protein
LAIETENIVLDEENLRLGIERALKLKDCYYYVAELDDIVIGQSMVTSEWSDWRNGIIWWIQSAYVNPTFRRKGVFKKIFN